MTIIRKTLVVWLVLAMAGTVFAAKPASLKGTVTSITDEEITLIAMGRTKHVHYDADTKFVKAGVVVTAKDLKVGDKVVITIEENHEGKGGNHGSHELHAAEVSFGAPAAKKPKKA